MAFTYAYVWLLINPNKDIIGAYGKFDKAVDDIPLAQQRSRRQIDPENWAFGKTGLEYILTKRKIKDSTGL